MTNVTGNFQSFLMTLDIKKTFITLMISSSLNDLLQEILEQFMSPITNKFLYKNEEKKIMFLGKEINANSLMNRVISLFVTLIIAFFIHRSLNN